MAAPRRFRVLLTARLFLHYREHTLYLMQTKGNGGGYTLPGGKIEGEEFAKEALIREAFEEIGISLTKKSLKLVHVMYKRLHSTTEIIFFFNATKWKNDLEVKELDKFSKYVWLPDDEPPQRLPAVIKAAMTCIADSKTYSQFPKKGGKKKKVPEIIPLNKETKPSKKADKKKKQKQPLVESTAAEIAFV